MNLRVELSNPASIGYIDTIIQFVYDYPVEFQELFEMAFDTDKNIAWRAGWACDKISRKKPEWFTGKHIERICLQLIDEKHGGVLRSLLSILNNLKLPENIPVELINKLFDWMISPRSDVSHQALSMKILYKLSLIQPDFKPELLAYLENISTYDYTPGFISTRKKILKLLK
ncbi:MAG: hypothetical protein LLF95_03215 [Bacteroidales bacterium]|nr:hypothetical protein [Bacteroidales bacterium]